MIDAAGAPDRMWGDLSALADATAVAAGAPVTIEDESSRVLAFSNEGQDVDPVRIATILGRQVPERWTSRLRRQAELDGVLAGDEPAVIALEGMAPRRVIAIRGGGMLLGSIWLAGPTTSAADDVLREAAAVAALHLLRRRAEHELQQAIQAAAVTDLLRSGELSSRVVEETGFRAADGFVVLVLGPSRNGASSDAPVLEQVVGMLTTHLLAFRRRAAHAVLDGHGYLVAACGSDEDYAALVSRLGDGLARIRRTVPGGVRAAIGTRASDAGGVPLARSTADRALALGAADDRIVTFDEVHAEALVQDIPAFVASRPGGPSPALRALLAHDREHRTELTETLRVVLERFGDTAAAAGALHVHANTVRYRLRQALEVTGVRLSEGPERLALELELRALATRTGSTGDPAPGPRASRSGGGERRPPAEPRE